jgi:dTMP kinase
MSCESENKPMAFLVFEGLDGSGKSTLIKKLHQLLKDRGLPSVLTHEPGGTSFAEEVRELILKTEGEPPVPMAELLLYQASRAQHVEQLIRPSLSQKKWVLCDRYYGSTLAFQCGGRGLDRNMVDGLNRLATGGLDPDLWVLLDLSLEESERRLQNREGKSDRMDQEKADFHRRVRDYYLSLANAEPEKWLVLNAEASPKELLSALELALKERSWLN